jgi:hypothetical protein
MIMICESLLYLQKSESKERIQTLILIGMSKFFIEHHKFILCLLTSCHRVCFLKMKNQHKCATHDYSSAGITQYGILFILLFFFSCTVKKHSSQKVIYELNNCHLKTYYDSILFFTPVANLEDITASNKELKVYTKHDLKIANALGLIHDLIELRRLEKTGQHSTELIEKKQFVIFQLLIAISSVSSVVAELDCEGERLDQIAYYLDDRQNKRVKKLTVASILAGATAGVATNALNPGHLSEAIGIGGGIGSALLALMTFLPKEKVYVVHKRNLLRDVWIETEHSTVYPSFIWSILKTPSLKNDSTSIYQDVKNSWSSLGQLGKFNTKERNNLIALYFGDEGKYTAEQLHVRADMVNQLMSAVRLINQDLVSLILAVSK